MNIIIAGATESGVQLAQFFSKNGHEVTLMDKDALLLQDAEEHLDVMTLTGNPTHRSTLIQAKIQNADGFVALSNEDNDNVLSAALAKNLGAQVSVARMDSPEFYLDQKSHEINLLGIDVILCPTRLGTVKLTDAIMATHLTFIHTFANASTRVALVTLGAHHKQIGKPASKIDFGGRVRTVAVVNNSYFRFADTVSEVSEGDHLLVVGAADDMLHLWRNSLPAKFKDRAFIVGGGDVGNSLAGIIESHVKRVEVIEKDVKRANEIAIALNHSIVFHGDARNTTFLQDQQIDTADYLLAVTGDDEVNLLVSLLGRKLGVPHPIAMLHRHGYSDLYRELGIERIVNINDMIARHAGYAVTPSGLIRSEKLPNTDYCVSEWRLPRHPVALDTPQMQVDRMPLPDNVRLIGITRGTTVIPFSNDYTLKGDETLVLLGPTDSHDATRKSLKKLLQEKHR